MITMLKTLCEVDDDHIVMIDTKYNCKSIACTLCRTRDVYT